MVGRISFWHVYNYRQCELAAAATADKNQRALGEESEDKGVSRELEQIHLIPTGNFWSWTMSLDFIAGCVGGCAGVLVGHPLDTIKVHLQTQDARNPRYRGIWHCTTTIVARDKISGLYRGITSPLAGVGFVNAIVFGIYGNVQRHTEDPNSLYSHFVAGSVAGLVQSIVCAPMELAKTRLQLQSNATNGGVKHKGPLDCLRHIMRTEGLRGAFKGLGITAMRDVPGFASYFVSYEYMMRQSTAPTAFQTLMAGGFAGIFSWLACYPMDVIKTRLQAEGLSPQSKYSGIWDCARKGYQTDGVYFFGRGLTSTLMRSFPMNAACFFVVSLIMRHTHGAAQQIDVKTATNLDVVVKSAEPLTIVIGGACGGDGMLCYMHNRNEHRTSAEEVARKRSFMVRSLNVLGAFNEAICHADVEQIADEFYPPVEESNKYYIFEDERILYGKYD